MKEKIKKKNEKMIEKIKEWSKKKSYRCNVKPRKENYPILVYRTSETSWEIWEKWKNNDHIYLDDQEGFIWFSLPKE